MSEALYMNSCDSDLQAEKVTILCFVQGVGGEGN